MGHVLARLSGYGMALTPHWPYVFERERDGSDAVRVTHRAPAGAVHAVIEPGRPPDGGDAVDVVEGPVVPYWIVETSVFRLRWPAGFTVESPSDAGDGTPFYLHGPGQAAIFAQGPVAKERLADANALVAPDQTVLQRRAGGGGVSVIELSYQHDSEVWWQAHWTVPYDADQVVVITAQSLLAASTQARQAAEIAATSFEHVR